jgi:hypothetical protein
MGVNTHSKVHRGVSVRLTSLHGDVKSVCRVYGVINGIAMNICVQSRAEKGGVATQRAKKFTHSCE